MLKMIMHFLNGLKFLHFMYQEKTSKYRNFGLEFDKSLKHIQFPSELTNIEKYQTFHTYTSDENFNIFILYCTVN